MKKLVALALAAGLMAGVFAGCSGNKATPETTAGSTSAATTAGSAKKDVTISYIASQDWVKDAEKELGNKFAEETGIKVDYQIIPADQYFNVLLTKLNSGEAADIFGSQSGKFDIVSQLNIEKNGVDLSGEEWAARMDPLVAEQLTTNGKLYGLMIWDTSPTFPIVYNKKIFESLSLKVPTNYAEFKADSQKILDSGVTPIYEAVSDGWHHVLWFPDIGPRYEEAEPGLTDKLNTNQAKFADSKIMETALTQLQEIAKLGYFGKNFLSNTYADLEKNMASGKYAMTLANMGVPQSIEKAFPDVKADTFGYFEIPLADNQILSMGTAGPSKFIYSQSKHIEEAKEYFRYITRPESLQYYLDNDTSKISLNFTGVKDKMNDEMKTFINSYSKKGTYYQIQIKYLNPQWMDIGKDMTAMFTGAETPKGILENIDKRRDEQAKAAKDPDWVK